MIYFLTGEIDLLEKDFVVINNNGIGYLVKITEMSYNQIIDLYKQKKEIKLYIFMTVKEENIILYGFLSRDELDIFNKLISVSGIGPKAAINILSKISQKEILLAIAKENIDLLSSVPGIGKKTAQRLILELKDKIEIKDNELDNLVENKIFLEAKEALINLGYNKIDVIKVIEIIKSKEIEYFSTEEIIKQALRFFAQKNN